MKQVIQKNTVLICLVVSMILIVVAAFKYPGGSLTDKTPWVFIGQRISSVICSIQKL